MKSYALFTVIFALHLNACGGAVEFEDPIDGSGATSSSASTTSSSTTSASTDSASTTGSEEPLEPPEECAALVYVNHLGHANIEAAPGDTGVLTVLDEVWVENCGQPANLNMRYGLGSLDGVDEFDWSPFCAEPCASHADYNFLNARLVREETGELLTGPFAFEGQTSNQPAVVEFEFSVKDSEKIRLRLLIDIANPPKTPIQGKRYFGFMLFASTDNSVLLTIGGVDPWDTHVTIK